MKKKMNLDQLKVQSFVTETRNVMGGAEAETWPVRECFDTAWCPDTQGGGVCETENTNCVPF